MRYDQPYFVRLVHWITSFMVVERQLRRICATLESEYGNPGLGNKADPLDELIFIILSNRTQATRAESVFQNLKRDFPSWSMVTPDNVDAITAIVQPAGLARLRARQIVSIVSKLKDRFGTATLEPLRMWTNDEAEAFLTSLPGVSKKVAKCVEMYSLNRDVLPVDVHVHRVADRLGFKVKKRPDTSQDLIEGVVPNELRYGFHVNSVAHGRLVCSPRNPHCERCCIAEWCNYHLQQRRNVE